MSVVISVGKSIIRRRTCDPADPGVHATAIAGQKRRRVDVVRHPMETNGGSEH
jgi:hypothetical protein